MHEGQAPAASRALTHKILSETSRFAVFQVINAVMGWIVQIALARLLDRRDFGVFGICWFYIGIGQLLGDGGLGATLLRRKHEATIEEYRATVTSLMCVAAVFALGLWIGAPFIAAHNHFNTAEMWALRALSPLYFLGAFRVTPYVRLERELRFSTIARIEFAAQLTRQAVALVVAFVHGGMWALILAQLSGVVVQLLAAYRASPGWVGLGWSWQTFKPLFAYGSRVQATTICAYLKDNLSRALFGMLLGPVAVGIYDFGTGYIQVPVVAVNGLARVQLPVYARLDGKDPALYAAICGAIRSALLLGLPFLGVLAWGAPWLITMLYGEKWTPAYPVVWGLLVNMVCSLSLSPLFTLLQGQGAAGRALVTFLCWTTGTWLLSLAAFAAGGGNLGLVAAACSVATLAVTTYLMVWVSRYLARNLFADLWRLLAAFVFALGGSALLSKYAGPLHPVAVALSFLALYVAVVALLDRERIVRELWALILALRTPRARAAPAEAS